MEFPKSPAHLAIAALLSVAPQVTAGPGQLDPGFNNHGYATVGGVESGGYLAVMEDGRTVVAGDAPRNDDGGFHDDIVISRYLPDGTYDGSFDDGIVSFNMGRQFQGGNSRDYASAVTVQPNGKILVAGYTRLQSNSTQSRFLVRLNVDGSFDDTFGEDGRLIWESDTSIESIIVLGSGKILLGGTTSSSGPYTTDGGVFVTRLNNDGSEDPAFLGNGEAFKPDNSLLSYFSAMALQPDGKIVVVGTSQNSGYDGATILRSDSLIIRLTAEGDLDTTFDGDGYREAATPPMESPSSVVIRPDGKILVGGTLARNDDEGNLRGIGTFVTRYTSTGSPDPSFSSHGTLTYRMGGITRMFLQKDGKIVFVGSTSVGSGDTDIAIVRFLSTGALDKGFGSGHGTLTDFGWKEYNGIQYSSNDKVRDAELLPDGKLLILGGGWPKNGFLARFSMLTQTDARVGSKASATKGNDIYNNSGAGQTLSLSVKRDGGKKTSYVRIQNDGGTTQPFLIQGTAGGKALTVKYLNGKEDVTRQVIEGIFQTKSLVPGASHLLKVEITAKTKARNKSRDFHVTGRAYTDLGSRDSVLIKTQTK